MLKNIDEHVSLEKAVRYYKKVFDEHPNSLQAPASLFMSGFILANELKNYKQAKIIYNLFLQKFPNHELAASAREELNNLGLSPEEILKNKKTQNI
jgi:TolA-binding protein